MTMPLRTPYLSVLAVTIGIGLLLVGAGNTRASILFDNSFDPAGPGQLDIGFSDLDVCCQRIAEDFSFTSPVVIEGITFLGGYHPTSTPETDSFTLTIYNDNGGVPDQFSIVTQINLGNFGRTFTGVTSLSVDIYRFSTSFAGVFLSANTPYWFTIVNDTTSDTNDDWVWVGLHGVGTFAISTDSGVSWSIGGPESWWFQLEGIVDPERTSLGIDIKPGNRRNVINPRSKGGIWVAILSDTDPESPFDPLSQVDIPTVEFGPDGATANRHKVKDINKDGLGDLLLRFKIPETGIACGDTEATLTGETFDGLSFTGTDSIRTVGCKSKKRNKKKHHKRHHGN